MKKIVLVGSIVIGALFFTINLKAQDCNFYFPTEKGTIVETTYFDKKHKETSKLFQEVLDYSKSGGVTEVKIRNTVEDEELDSALLQEYSLRCENGEFYINMEGYLDKGTLSKYQGMEFDISSEKMTIPSNLSAGQNLDDGSVSVTISNSGMKMFTMTVNITNRKVEGFEKVTTPAGTFDCVKISFDSEMKMIFKVKVSGIQWFCNDIGVVKSENYDKKGKLTGTSEITKITK